MTPPQIVYVTAVLSRLNDPLYERAVRKVRQLHPYAAILSAKTLWANREGWLATYEAVLAAVTHVYIMAVFSWNSLTFISLILVRQWREFLVRS
jgi:hypothetical protein